VVQKDDIFVIFASSHNRDKGRSYTKQCNNTIKIKLDRNGIQRDREKNKEFVVFNRRNWFEKIIDFFFQK